jgi:hypothetical protein
MDDELVTVRTYFSDPYAEADRMHLSAAGIPAFVLDDNSATWEWLLYPEDGFIKLQVPQSHYDEAMAILKEHDPDQAPADETTGDAVRCLACGKPMSETDTKCAECGWSYADAEEPQEATTEQS